MRPRVIPSILVDDRYLVKTAGFRKPVYVGDPINTVRLFNDKQADELMVVDIGRAGRPVDFEFIESVVSEAFMPVTYGGGVRTFVDARRVIDLGVEKVLLNDACFSNPRVISEIAEHFGSQAVVCGIDVATSRWRGQAVIRHGVGRWPTPPGDWARILEEYGGGEILITDMNREGARGGYNLDLISQVSSSVAVPVVANGGAGGIGDFKKAVDAGAAAVSAGTMFTFRGPNRAVLISYPSEAELAETLGR